MQKIAIINYSEYESIPTEIATQLVTTLKKDGYDAFIIHPLSFQDKSSFLLDCQTTVNNTNSQLVHTRTSITNIPLETQEKTVYIQLTPTIVNIQNRNLHTPDNFRLTLFSPETRLLSPADRLRKAFRLCIPYTMDECGRSFASINQGEILQSIENSIAPTIEMIARIHELGELPVNTELNPETVSRIVQDQNSEIALSICNA